MEMRFVSSPVPSEIDNSEFNWIAPGDYDWLNAEVAKGKGFNGQNLDRCELNQKIAGKATKAKRMLCSKSTNISEDI
eukprot:14376126-Ditylum_brightwellii.AAC.1